MASESSDDCSLSKMPRWPAVTFPAGAAVAHFVSLKLTRTREAPGKGAHGQEQLRSTLVLRARFALMRFGSVVIDGFSVSAVLPLPLGSRSDCVLCVEACFFLSRSGRRGRS